MNKAEGELYGPNLGPRSVHSARMNGRATK